MRRGWGCHRTSGLRLCPSDSVSAACWHCQLLAYCLHSLSLSEHVCRSVGGAVGIWSCGLDVGLKLGPKHAAIASGTATAVFSRLA